MIIGKVVYNTVLLYKYLLVSENQTNRTKLFDVIYACINNEY
jgi:hypothetical protein